MHNWNTSRRKNQAEVFEVKMAEDFPKFMTDTKPQIPEAQSTPSKCLCINKSEKQKYPPPHTHLVISYSSCGETETKRKS